MTNKEDAREAFESKMNVHCLNRNEQGDYVIGAIDDAWRGFLLCYESMQAEVDRLEECNRELRAHVEATVELADHMLFCLVEYREEIDRIKPPVIVGLERSEDRFRRMLDREPKDLLAAVRKAERARLKSVVDQVRVEDHVEDSHIYNAAIDTALDAMTNMGEE